MSSVNRDAGLSNKFDWEIYLQCNPTLKDLNTYEAAHEHWVKIGRARGLVATEEQFYSVYQFNRSDLPSDFDWQTYLKLNPDVAARMNSKWQAIRHFLKYGIQEGRPYYNKRESIQQIESSSLPGLSTSDQKSARQDVQSSSSFELALCSQTDQLPKSSGQTQKDDFSFLENWPAYEGALQSSRYPYIRGWVWDKNNPEQRLVVEVLLNGKQIAIIKADHYGQDVYDHGKGDGHKCFQIRLTQTLDPNQPHYISAKVANSNYILKESPRLLEFDQQAHLLLWQSAKQTSSFEGKLEQVTENGIRGWARNKKQVDATLTVEILDNDQVIERCLANEFRLDLQKAGKGEGKHGFKLPLSTTLRDGKVHNITARISGTQHFLIEKPINFVYSPQRSYQNLEEYLRWAMLHREFSSPFRENDKRILGYMDWYTNRLAKIYAYLEQDVKISVIMPAHNREAIISLAINSVLQQSYQNWELLVIDDGSQDKTCDIVAAFDDPRIILLKLPSNLGVSKARNVGLTHAQGEYIAYLDTDNTMDCHFLLLMVNTLKKHPEAESVYCAQRVTTIYHSEVNGKDEIHTIRFGPFNRSLLENRNYLDLNAYVHTKDLYTKLGGFNESMRRLVDWDLVLRYTKESFPISVPCILSNYYHGVADNQITKLESLEEASSYITKNLKQQVFHLPFDGNNEEQEKKRIQYDFFYHTSKQTFSKEPIVSIIIPSYEVPEYLEYCVQSVKRFTPVEDYELIIVDNGSSDKTIQVLKQFERQGVKVIYNSENMGFTYAVNQGIEAASPDSHIVLLNNDALVTPGWLAEMMIVLQEENNVGVIVPRQVLLPQTPTMNIHVPYSNSKREVDVSLSAHHQNVLYPDTNPIKGYVEISFAPFFCVLISRECLTKVGLLDAKNGRHYRSDRLYCDSVRNFAKLRIIYTPRSKLYHFLQQATSHLKTEEPQKYQTIFLENTWRDEAEVNLVLKQVEESEI